ncbi:MAG: lamin tail domain-containing protein [Saprospiraceae bacterium]
MKKFFTLIMSILWTSYISYGQIVITEISYNPPETNTDSLEYLELYNAGLSAVNLKDYKITKGVEFTFPDVTINSKAYLLLSVKANAFQNVYGKPSLQWTAGALNNGGEVIAIADASGTEIISVDLKDVPPWPGLIDGTDGDGKSIELCDPAADPNNGANWKVSKNDLGIQINGKQVFGTPGEANSVTECGEAPPNLYPLRTIFSMSSVNADGVVDSLGKNCTLRGIVYGVNQRPEGLQFTIIDAQNNGIGAFSNSLNYGYTVKEGDDIEIKGSIAQFNGFTQMNLAEVKLLSQSNTLIIPKQITDFQEVDESSLVTLANVSFLDPSQWTGTGSGFNMTMVNGIGTQFTIRIDNDVDAYSAAIPSSSSFFVTGLLGQFDSTSPYNEGYQLLPRYLVDFAPAGSTDNVLDTAMKVQPNPSNNILTIITESQPDRLILYNVKGQLLNQYTNTLNIDMSGYDQGVYLLKAIKGERSSTVRIIKM